MIFQNKYGRAITVGMYENALVSEMQVFIDSHEKCVYVND